VAAPRGKSTAALERQIDELQANADEAERRVDDMADLYAQERSPTAKRRLTEMERQLKEYQKQLRDLRAQRDTMTTASVKDRLKAVERVLAGNEDVIEVNKTLRDAVRRIVVDPEQGCLWIRWHHSDEIQDITFVTRHMSFEDFRETTPPMHALFPERMAAQSQSV
jgi:nicotinamide mononucleotide adenylyltransferase